MEKRANLSMHNHPLAWCHKAAQHEKRANLSMHNHPLAWCHKAAQHEKRANLSMHNHPLAWCHRQLSTGYAYSFQALPYKAGLREAVVPKLGIRGPGAAQAAGGMQVLID